MQMRNAARLAAEGSAETKWHREAKRMIATVEREGSAAVKPAKPKAKKPKKKPLRTRAYKKLARKHPIMAPFAWLFVALATLVGKGTQYGGKYGARAAGWSGVRVGRASQAAAQRLANKVIADVHKRKWVPEADLIDGKRPREFYRCGEHQFTSVEALNNYLRTARTEPTDRPKPQPKLQVGATARTAGKVLVLPAEKTGGRHRRSHNLPGARNATDLVNAYRDNLNKIGARIVALTDTTHRLRQAATQFGQTPRPDTLAQLRNTCVGMEQAMGALRDAIGEFGMMLKRPSNPDGSGGANIEPALVNPYFLRAQEHADGVGSEFTKFIAAFEAFYAIQIRAAGGQIATPNMDLSKTG